MTATDNLPQGGTDSAQPSTSLDDPANWDYFDPDDEKQDTEKPKAATGTAVEQAEEAPEAVQEATDEQQEPAAEEPDEKPAEKQAATSFNDDVKITLKGGDEVTLRELRDGYMRQSDYSRKRQMDAQRATHIQQVAENISNFLQSQIPPMPDPAMAYQNSSLYAAQLAQHDAAKRQWEAVTNVKNFANEQANSFTEEQRQEVLQAERARLLEALPIMADEKGREKATKAITEAADYLGLSPDEVSGLIDHRHVRALYYAAKGIAAEKAEKIAKQKVANVPPVAPAKRQVQQGSVAQKNAEAMKRLSRSGSIYDAMNVDFD